MAINSPRIAGQPATERWRVIDQPFVPRSAVPTESSLAVVNGTLTYIDALTPEREGQLSFVLSVDESGLNRSSTIYVAVDIGGTLTWKRVVPVPDVINKYTGKPFDPIYDQ